MDACVAPLKWNSDLSPIRWVNLWLADFRTIGNPLWGESLYVEINFMCKDFCLMSWPIFLFQWEHFPNIWRLSAWMNGRYKLQQVLPGSRPCSHLASNKRNIYMGKKHRDFTKQNKGRRLTPTSQGIGILPALGSFGRKFPKSWRKHHLFPWNCLKSPVNPRHWKKSASNILDISCLVGGPPSKNSAMCKFHWVVLALRTSRLIPFRCNQPHWRSCL